MTVIIGGIVTIISAIGTTAVLVINAIKSMREETKATIAVIDTKVDKVALQTDGLTTKVVEFAKAAGVAEGAATAGAEGAERAAALSASREEQATVDEIARAAVTADLAATAKDEAEARPAPATHDDTVREVVKTIEDNAETKRVADATEQVAKETKRLADSADPTAEKPKP